jgi:tetratricopeptide (TPR) repeat protein
LSEKANEIARKMGFRWHLSRQLSGTGKVYNTVGDTDRGRECLEEALQIMRETGGRTEDFTLDCYSEILIAVGDFDRAMDYLQQAYQVQERTGERNFRCNTLNNMGYINFLRGDYGQALALYTEAMQLGTKVKNVWGLGFTNGYLCDLWLLLGVTGKVGRHIDGLRRVNDIVKSMRATVMIGVYSARLRAAEGRLERAAELLDNAERLILEKTEEAILYVSCLLAGVELEMCRRDLERAHEYARRLLDYSLERERVPDVARAEHALANVALRQQDFDAASAHASQALENATGCGMKEYIWQARHVLGRVHMKKGERVQARDELKQAEGVVRSIVEGLSDDLSKLYLARPAYRSLQVDLEVVA